MGRSHLWEEQLDLTGWHEPAGAWHLHLQSSSYHGLAEILRSKLLIKSCFQKNKDSTIPLSWGIPRRQTHRKNVERWLLGLAGGQGGTYCSMDLEFQFYKVRKCWGGGVRRSQEDFQGSENILHEATLIDTRRYTSVQTCRMCSTGSERCANRIHSGDDDVSVQVPQV